MSSTNSSEDQALAEIGPRHNLGSAEQSMQRSLATYRYENALVKTELAAALEKHSREINELKLKYQAQVRDVERQRGELEMQLKDLEIKYADENRQLQQVNLNVNQQLRIAEEELEASSKAHENVVKQKEKVEEQCQQRIFANQASLQSLREEKSRLEESLEQLHGELDKERVSLREVSTTLNAERHQQQLIKSRLAEIEQKCKIQLTAAQAEASQLRQKSEQEAKEASNRISDLKNTLEEERLILASAKERASAKELEMERRFAEEKQSLLSNSQQLVQQNSLLQERIKGLESTLSTFETKQDSRARELEAKEQKAVEKLYEVEREKVVLEARVGALENLEELLRKEREESSILRQEIHRHQSEAEQLRTLNSELQLRIKQLENKITEQETQQELAKQGAKKELDTGQRLMAEQQATHQEELEQLRARIASLQANFNDRNKNYLEESNQLKQKVRTYAKLIKKLRYKLEMGEVQVELLEAKQTVLKENVPSHVYHRLQSQFQDILRKHSEFAAFVRGLREFQSALPEVSELTNHLEAVDQKINELEEDQLHLLSEMESL